MDGGPSAKFCELLPRYCFAGLQGGGAFFAPCCPLCDDLPPRSDLRAGVAALVMPPPDCPLYWFFEFEMLMRRRRLFPELRLKTQHLAV